MDSIRRPWRSRLRTWPPCWRAPASRLRGVQNPGAAAAIFGAIFVASLMAAEGIASSALAAVPAGQRSGVVAGAHAMLDAKGALPIVNLAFFMLLGLVLLGIGLVRGQSLPRWVGLCVIAPLASYYAPPARA